jgi:signal transduction histidine kinase
VVASVKIILPESARRVAAEFEAGGRPVETEVSGAAEVSGDPGLIEQVLWALLDNAFVHGAPPVRLDVWTEDDHGVVAVSDHGTGLTPDQRSSLLHPDGRGGIGLGLSIVQGIVSSCNGSVLAETADGGGARFRVTLPLARQAAPQGREEMTA